MTKFSDSENVYLEFFEDKLTIGTYCIFSHAVIIIMYNWKATGNGAF
jgi:hypothetical protein